MVEGYPELKNFGVCNANGGGTGDYNNLINLPQINSVTLVGNKTARQLNLATYTELDELDTRVENLEDDIQNLETTNFANGVVQPVVNSESTNTQIPTAKSVYDLVINEKSRYLTKNASGDPFASKEELMTSTAFYFGGNQVTPKAFDYAIVEKDEAHDNFQTRYSFIADV